MSDKNQEESIFNEEGLLKEKSTDNSDEKLLSDDDSLLNNDENTTPESETTTNDQLTDNMTEPDNENSSEEALLNENPPSDNPIENTNNDDLLNSDQTVDAMSAAPFDKTLGDINSTLNNLEKKIETEQDQLKKLDQLADIKSELVKINQTRSMTGSSAGQGHNLQEISDLMEKIDAIENRLNNLESSSKTKFADVDNVITRFNALEKELDIEYEDDEKTNSGSSFMKLFDGKDTDKKEEKNNDGIISHEDNRVKELEAKEKEKKQSNQNAKILLLFLLLLILTFWALDFFGIVELHLLKYFTI